MSTAQRSESPTILPEGYAVSPPPPLVRTAEVEPPLPPEYRMPSVDEAWAAVEHRAAWIGEQMQAVRAIHESSGQRHSYIKAVALVLAMKAVLAGLDALSELIPA